MSPPESSLTPDRVLPMDWGSFSFSDNGSGRPVIYLHGYGGSRHDWSALTRLSQGMRCIRPDFRGHGGSSVPRDSFRLRHLAQDILSLADQLWLGTFDIVGHSLGGMVAQEILRRAPQRLTRLVLIEGWVSLQYSKALHKSLYECVPAELTAQIKKNWHESLVRWMPGIRDEFWYSVEHFNGQETLAKSAQPVLAIFGTHGRGPLSQETLGLPARADIQVQWIDNAGHYPHMSTPQNVWKHIQPFLSGEAPVEPEEPETETENTPPPSLLQLALLETHRPGGRTPLPQSRRRIEAAYGNTEDTFLFDLMKQITKAPPKKSSPENE